MPGIPLPSPDFALSACLSQSVRLVGVTISSKKDGFTLDHANFNALISPQNS